MDPETALDVHHAPTGAGGDVSREAAALPGTVHWDPAGPDGRRVGWKVKIEEDPGGGWREGRVVRYDPHTHKHKIRFDGGDNDDDDDDVDSPAAPSCWIWLRHEQHNLQLAVRMVWAHVKGYAWWPALVMEANAESAKCREGYVLIEFFGTGEISCLRDHPENVRPFDPDAGLDPVVARHRKKRNQRAYQLACAEHRRIRRTRNAAALHYARAALNMAGHYAPAPTAGGGGRQQALIGRRVRLFRSDVNYPYGDTVIGTVRQYSPQQKRWLLSFEISEQQSNKTKYPPAWLNLCNRENKLKVLPSATPTTTGGGSSSSKKNTSTTAEEATTTRNEDLLPFLFGYEPVEGDDDAAEMAELLRTRCRGCVEYLKVGGGGGAASSPPDGLAKAEPTVTCGTCRGTFHLGCVDPPLATDQWQRLLRDGGGGPAAFTCARCAPCRGCYGRDIAFGSHAHPSPPPTLTLPDGGALPLRLCSTCRGHYDAERFCPNCAHTW